nr:hypothetical protein [Tanacetum cinerariifolium]
QMVLGLCVKVMGSRVVMEMGEKMAEKGVGKKGGKHYAGHSVLNTNVTWVSTIGILHIWSMGITRINIVSPCGFNSLDTWQK